MAREKIRAAHRDGQQPDPTASDDEELREMMDFPTATGSRQTLKTQGIPLDERRVDNPNTYWGLIWFGWYGLIIWTHPPQKKRSYL